MYHKEKNMSIKKAITQEIRNWLISKVNIFYVNLKFNPFFLNNESIVIYFSLSIDDKFCFYSKNIRGYNHLSFHRSKSIIRVRISYELIQYLTFKCQKNKCEQRKIYFISFQNNTTFFFQCHSIYFRLFYLTLLNIQE
jgi:hypothetical protein